MVTQALTPELIDAGEKLLEALDASGLNVPAAFWFFSPEPGVWKLMLSIPGLVGQGPKKAYKRIQACLAKIPEAAPSLSLDDVVLAKGEEPILELLRRGTRTTGRGISHIRFTNNVINGVLIHDAYIYRLL